MSAETHMHKDSPRDTLGAGGEGRVGTDPEPGLGGEAGGGGRGSFRCLYTEYRVSLCLEPVAL